MSDTLTLPDSSIQRPRAPWLRRLVIGSGLAALLWLLAQLGATATLAAATADPLRSLTSLSTIFLGIFIEAVPFIALGVVVSAALHLFVSEATLARLLPRRALPATLVGAALGFIFPVCECGVVPVSRRLIQKGVPISLGIAFLLAAPVVNPVVIVSTLIAFGGDWRMVAWRVGLSYAIAVAVGLVFAVHPRPRALLATASAGAGGCGCAAGCDCDHAHHAARPTRPGDRLLQLTWHSGTEFVEMSRYLILGALLAALMQTFVPRASLLALGSAPISSVLVMIALAVVLSICSTVDAFIALSFAGAFSTGSILAFLVFGPMIDVKATLMFLSVFQRRAVGVIILLVFQMVLLASLFINYTWG
jgi:uncharacterized membrane protein YraQ (UPF0718 family)